MPTIEKSPALVKNEYEWNSGSYLAESLDSALELRNRLGWEVFTILPSVQGVAGYLFVVLRRPKEHTNA